jgi:hypothetical protein
MNRASFYTVDYMIFFFTMQWRCKKMRHICTSRFRTIGGDVFHGGERLPLVVSEGEKGVENVVAAARGGCFRLGCASGGSRGACKKKGFPAPFDACAVKINM